MSSPLVSITIPSYKPAHFEQSLRSALGQSYAHIEILVSDNCPTEAIHDICRRFPQVQYRRNPERGVANVAASLLAGQGEFVKPLFDDDILHPFCIERMVRAMQLAPSIELVFSASAIIDGSNMRQQVRRPFQQNGMLDGRLLYRWLALGPANVIGELSSILLRRASLQALGRDGLFRIGGHDFALGLADAALYCNLLHHAQAYYLDEELSYFRRDAGHASNSNPAANPNYGQCLSDGIDLMLAGHRQQVLSGDDLRTGRPTVEALVRNAGADFPQLLAAYQRYVHYLAELDLSTHSHPTTEQ
jgi:glycosyltransferase involved in cell wall biosynthesis